MNYKLTSNEEVKSDETFCSNKKRDCKRERKTNKQRAKECRDRKKLYFDSLEAENKKMALEIDRLKEENARLKQSLPFSKSDIGLEKQLNMHENFFLNNLRDIIQATSDTNWCGMVKNMEQVTGSFSSKRVELVKDSFRAILENLIPVQTKTYAVLFQHFTNKKLISLIKARELSDKNKYIKWSCHKEEDLQQILKNLDLSPNFVNHLVNNAPEYKRKFDKLGKLTRSIVTLQNSIFSQMDDLANVTFVPDTAEFQDFVTL